MNDTDRAVASGAAESLSRYPEHPDAVLPAATRLLKRLLKSGEDGQVVAALRLLDRLVPNLEQWGEDQFADDDEWLLAFRHFLAALDA